MHFGSKAAALLIRKSLKEKLSRGALRSILALSARVLPFIGPPGATLEQLREKKNQSSLHLLLADTNLLNEQLVPGAHRNVSIVVFLVSDCAFIFWCRNLYDDDNRD